MVHRILAAVAASCLLASTPLAAQGIDRATIMKDPKVFGLFVTLKMRPDYATLPAAKRRAGAVSEIQAVIAKHRDNVLADFFLTRGLDTESDILVRVHAYDLVKAQNFVIDLRATTLGMHADVEQKFVGMTNALIYAHKSPGLTDSLKATTYSDPAPRFVVMIPIKKSAEWWTLPHDQRLKLIEEHTILTLGFLATIKRKLYHSTGHDDVDFMTCFEFADVSAFHELSKVLMAVGENRYHVQWGNPTLIGRIDSLENVLTAVAGG